MRRGRIGSRGPGRRRRGGGGSASLLAISLAALVGACYRGDFLAAACDRQGTCFAEEATTTTTTGDPSEGSESDPSDGSTGDAPALDAYRMTSIRLVDPHFYYMIAGCEDVTALFNSALTGELADGTINVLLLLDPADPDLDEAPMRLTEGECVVGATATSCKYKDPASYVPTIATNVLASTCDAAVPDTVNPLYAADGVPNLPAPPCFVSQRGAVILPALAPGLPPIVLFDAQIAATYGAADPPVDTLVSGILTGFVPESYALQFSGAIEGLAFNLWGSIAGGGACQKDPNVPIDDTDPNPDPRNSERGVQVYLNFAAERVEWIE